MGKMEELAVLETVNGKGVALEIGGQELQELCALFDEYRDLIQRINPDGHFSDCGYNLRMLLHLLVTMGRDAMLDKVLDMREQVDTQSVDDLPGESQAAGPALEDVPADAPAETLVEFAVSEDELGDIVDAYVDWEQLRCLVDSKHRLSMDIPEIYHLLAITGLDVMRQDTKEFKESLEARHTQDGLQALEDGLLDDVDRQALKEEVRQAYLNGGRTPYLYDLDGNEYYTTRDGIRHYTRIEG